MQLQPCSRGVWCRRVSTMPVRRQFCLISHPVSRSIISAIGVAIAMILPGVASSIICRVAWSAPEPVPRRSTPMPGNGTHRHSALAQGPARGPWRRRQMWGRHRRRIQGGAHPVRASLNGSDYADWSRKMPENWAMAATQPGARRGSGMNALPIGRTGRNPGRTNPGEIANGARRPPESRHGKNPFGP